MMKRGEYRRLIAGLSRGSRRVGDTDSVAKAALELGGSGVAARQSREERNDPALTSAQGRVPDEGKLAICL